MKSAIKITLTYIALSSVWIIFSDRLINTITSNAAVLTTLASIKGLLFVTITGSILYLQVRKEIRIKNNVIATLDREIEIKEQLIRELHHRIKNNLQAFLGLLNIETENNDGLSEPKNRITNKLLSMVAIFNIVYDMHDLSNISIKKVLEEYKKISSRNLKIGECDERVRYSIETITSCILLTNSVIEAIDRTGTNLTQVELGMPQAGVISIGAGKGHVLDQNMLHEGDREFIEVQLASIDGQIEFEAKEGKVTIRFYDKYK